MNRVNPFYIGISLFIVLIFVMLKLSGVSDEYYNAKESYKETLVLANELHGLKDIYANKLETKKSLQKILNHSALKSAEIKQQSKKSSIKISSQSMDMKTLNFLMAKILNGTYQIKNLKIKQLSKIRVSLDMEIKW